MDWKPLGNQKYMKTEFGEEGMLSVILDPLPMLLCCRLLLNRTAWFTPSVWY